MADTIKTWVRNASASFSGDLPFRSSSDQPCSSPSSIVVMAHGSPFVKNSTQIIGRLRKYIEPNTPELPAPQTLIFLTDVAVREAF